MDEDQLEAFGNVAVPRMNFSSMTWLGLPIPTKISEDR